MRHVEASPVDGNPYHADIRMNLQEPVSGEKVSDGPNKLDPEKQSRARQTQHALELALSAEWDDPKRTAELLTLGVRILDQIADQTDLEADYKRFY